MWFLCDTCRTVVEDDSGNWINDHRDFCGICGKETLWLKYNYRGKKVEMDKSVLAKIHAAMDRANGAYGEKGKLCIYCGANTYNGAEGIIHKYDCPIILLREKLCNQK
jgi:hypothetical protein